MPGNMSTRKTRLQVRFDYGATVRGDAVPGYSRNVKTVAGAADPDRRFVDPRRTVLIVEDEPDLRELLKRRLDAEGWAAQAVATGEAALQLAQLQHIDLVLLDIMLPGIDGMEVCRRLRSAQLYVPVIMLTARSSELDKVLGLETGADDYLTKPFSLKELVARVRAMFRRLDALDAGQERRPQPIRLGGRVVVDPSSRDVRVDGRHVALTHKEFELLLHFARNPERVFTREQLLDAVWGYTHDAYEHAVNCHINRLRSKIELNPGEPQIITTVWGVGYKLARPED